LYIYFFEKAYAKSSDISNTIKTLWIKGTM